MAWFALVVEWVAVIGIGAFLEAFVTIIKVNYTGVVFALLTVIRTSVA